MSSEPFYDRPLNRLAILVSSVLLMSVVGYFSDVAVYVIGIVGGVLGLGMSIYFYAEANMWFERFSDWRQR